MESLNFDDLAAVISQIIHVEDLKNLRLASKFLHQMFSDEEFWQRVIQLRYGLRMRECSMKTMIILLDMFGKKRHIKMSRDKNDLGEKFVIAAINQSDRCQTQKIYRHEDSDAMIRASSSGMAYYKHIHHMAKNGSNSINSFAKTAISKNASTPYALLHTCYGNYIRTFVMDDTPHKFRKMVPSFLIVDIEKKELLFTHQLYIRGVVLKSNNNFTQPKKIDQDESVRPVSLYDRGLVMQAIAVPHPHISNQEYVIMVPPQFSHYTNRLYQPEVKIKNLSTWTRVYIDSQDKHCVQIDDGGDGWRSDIWSEIPLHGDLLCSMMKITRMMIEKEKSNYIEVSLIE